MTILGGLASPSILIVSPVIDTVILSDCVHIHGNDTTFFIIYAAKNHKSQVASGGFTICTAYNKMLFSHGAAALPT